MRIRIELSNPIPRMYEGSTATTLSKQNPGQQPGFLLFQRYYFGR